MWCYDLSWRNTMNHLALLFIVFKNKMREVIHILPRVETDCIVKYDASKDKQMTGGRHRQDMNPF